MEDDDKVDHICLNRHVIRITSFSLSAVSRSVVSDMEARYATTAAET